MFDLIDTKYEVSYTSRFKKQLKKKIKQGKDIKKLEFVVSCLANGEVLEPKYRDHMLIDNKYFSNCRECHIEPDWLLIYKYMNNGLVLVLFETGSHSEILDM